jgi:hypothetical protein
MFKPYDDSFVPPAVFDSNLYSAGPTLILIDPKNFFQKEAFRLSFFVNRLLFFVHHFSSIVQRFFRTALRKKSFMLHYIRSAIG